MRTAAASLLTRARSRAAAVRARRPALDRVARAVERYQRIGGNQHAGAITYFAFLSFFPLVAIGFAVLGHLGRVRPDLVAEALATVSGYLPGLVGDGPGQINLDRIADAAAGASVLGVIGLLYAGLGWVDALRTALRATFTTTGPKRSIVVRKLIDLAVLVVLGLSLLASVAITSVATSATTLVLGWLELADSLVATALLRVLAVVVAVAADALVLFVVFVRLPGRAVSWADGARGALLGAVMLEVLKLAGTLLVARVTTNAVYGVFAVVVGLLVWLNLVSRVVLLAAAWTAAGTVDGRVPAPRPDDEAAGQPRPQLRLAPQSRQSASRAARRDRSR